MGLSATKFFKHWPEMQAEFDEISLHNAWMETLKHSGEQMVEPKLVAERLKAQGLNPNIPPGTFQMRPLVYKMIFNQVERLGVDVQFNSRVVEYEEMENNKRAACRTEDGRRYEADVIIAADGVGSKSQKIVGGQVRAESSGRAMWRAAFPVEVLDQKPDLKAFFHRVGPNRDQPVIRAFLGPGTYGMVLTRSDVLVWIINHNVGVAILQSNVDN